MFREDSESFCVVEKTIFCINTITFVPCKSLLVCIRINPMFYSVVPKFLNFPLPSCKSFLFSCTFKLIFNRSHPKLKFITICIKKYVLHVYFIALTTFSFYDFFFKFFTILHKNSFLFSLSLGS